MTTPMEARAATLAAELGAQGREVTPDLRVQPDVAAAVIGVSVGTLKNWRNAEMGPDYFKAGRIWYSLVDVLRWIESRRQSCDS
jgi:thiamine monophosphate synthase